MANRDRPNWTFNRRSPVYIQLVDHFKASIVNGHYTPGQTVPSRRELARMLQINPNTAQRAYKLMEKQKLLETDGNARSTITEDQARIDALTNEMVGQAVDDFVRAVRPARLPMDRLLALIKARYAKEEKDAGDQ